MLTIEPSGGVMGAAIRGVDLSKPLDGPTVGTIFHAIGRYGCVSFPNQDLKPAALRDFTANFGEVQKSKGFIEPGMPEVSVISNMVVDGKNIGYNDSGPIWHRDMTYRGKPGFANVLYAVKVPRRDGQALGDTLFLNTGAVYDDLPKDVQKRLVGTFGVHDVGFYSRSARKKLGQRDTVKHTRHTNEPNLHPILMTHPITGKTIVYCDIGHVTDIQGLPEDEGEEMLRYLTEVQTRPKYEYAYKWAEGDVLMWDNLSSLHRGSFDYGLEEHRLIKRSQAIGDKIFDPAFMKSALAQAGIPA
jgi:taurine dioxygenase